MTQEWLCDSCRTIYPGPKGFDLTCLCGKGLLRPTSLRERRLETENERLRAALRWCRTRLATDCYRNTLDEILAQPDLKGGEEGGEAPEPWPKTQLEQILKGD